MKKHLLPLAVMAAAILSGSAAGNTDPVVMKINGKDITRSEFKYLYEKNNLQQVNPQSIDDYVDMFVVYKLKVADAEAAGIDTTATFLKEFGGYCADLSRPYMRDTVVENRLVREAYDRMGISRRVSHIMAPMGKTPAEREASRMRLDSIRTAILAGADFGEMAAKYSYDRSATKNHGDMGFITANTYPYLFEKVAYDTPVGQMSEVFEDAPYGYHIIKVTDEKPNPGTITARHILKVTRGLPTEQAALKKAAIDSIYTLLKNGADFEELARRESEDRGSAAKGGNLGEFGTGQMVPEFEKTAFALQPGEISEPFTTAFGYHIVQTLSHKGMPSIEQVRPSIIMSMARDIRGKMPEKARIEQFKEKYGITTSASTLESVASAVAHVSGAAAAFDALAGSDLVVANLPEGKVITVAEVCASIPDNVKQATPDPLATFTNAADAMVDDATAAYAREQIAKEDVSFRNLINEYRDGILLFEVSNRNVWDRAAKDNEALENYFRTNRSKYTWEKPRLKGYVIFATSDSIASEARGLLARTAVETDSLVKTLRTQFGNEIKIERVLAQQGDNEIVDEIAFGGAKAKPVGKWVAWFPYQTRVLDAPEEAADVRGLVTTDLQQQLEEEWVASLRKKYPVKLNKKEIKKLSSSSK